MLGGMIKVLLISILIKYGNQICVGQFGTTNDPVTLSANFFCHILPLNLIYKTLDWGREWFVDFDARKMQLVLFDWFNNTSAIDDKMYGSILEEKSFKMLGLAFSSKLDWGSYVSLLLQMSSRKLET